MIRPIQRLPSILLLLERLLKYTSRTHIDYQLLIDSLDKLREIAKKLNDERGKTEKHLSMFNIVNSIDNCPVRKRFSIKIFKYFFLLNFSRNYLLHIVII
jgi:hypothetical protein